MNWEFGIDMYSLMRMKWITNKNLLYKKVNKIKLKNLKKMGRRLEYTLSKEDIQMANRQ